VSNGWRMTWVVKRWRMEGLERVLCEEAVEAARAASAAAERDARRAQRAADRTAADATAQLAELERLGLELHASVRRARSRPDVAQPAAPPDSSTPAPAPVVVVASRRRRHGRASLRGSSLSELFRATTAG
jgi:hypothetical protein